MNNQIFFDETYNGVIFSEDSFFKGNYEACSFVQCDFSGMDLSMCKFIDTEFVECNLSNANISACSFQDVKFVQSKMLGLRFDEINDFGFSVEFDSCQMNHSSFYGSKLGKSSFNNCSLIEVDFERSELKAVPLIDCDMLNVIFGKTNLEKASLIGSFNYSIDPEANNIKGARFSRDAVFGLLDKYKIVIE